MSSMTCHITKDDIGGRPVFLCIINNRGGGRMKRNRFILSLFFVDVTEM